MYTETPCEPYMLGGWEENEQKTNKNNYGMYVVATNR